MKKFFGLMLMASAFTFNAGCDSSGGTAVENADQTAIEKYEAIEAAEQEKMKTDMADTQTVD